MAGVRSILKLFNPLIPASRARADPVRLQHFLCTGSAAPPPLRQQQPSSAWPGAVRTLLTAHHCPPSTRHLPSGPATSHLFQGSARRLGTGTGYGCVPRGQPSGAASRVAAPARAFAAAAGGEAKADWSGFPFGKLIAAGVLGLFAAGGYILVEGGKPDPDYIAACQRFLEENKKKEGVVVLPSGLQYRVLESGGGGDHPRVSAPCLCHYHGTLINGAVFDSSINRGQPITFAPNQVIPGWTEAMQLMVEGDKWELVIPEHLAYGKAGAGGVIPGSSTLVFIIQLIKINGPRTPAVKN